MKKTLKYTFLFLALAFASVSTVMAQPHPGEQNGGVGVTGERIGDAPSGAPVGNGTNIFLIMALAYAGRKLYKPVKEEE